MKFLKLQGPQMPFFINVSKDFSCRSWKDEGLELIIHPIIFRGPKLSNSKTLGTNLVIYSNFHKRFNLVNSPNFEDFFGFFKLSFDFLTSFHSRPRFCRFFVIFRLFMKYMYLHLHYHKNTHLLWQFRLVFTYYNYNRLITPFWCVYNVTVHNEYP